MRRRASAALAALVLAACGDGASRVEHAPVAAGWTMLASPTSESLRGLCVVSREVAWASGANGTVLRTLDGETWARVPVPPGAEALDLRSLHALDASRAVVLSAGSPARMLVTGDGGAHWEETYANDDPAIFFDALVLVGEAGLALGDPMAAADGARFVLLATEDGGRTWAPREGPLAIEGEAAFAASDGSLALPSAGVTIFATGGSVARVHRRDGDGAWTSTELAGAGGAASRGVFALRFRDAEVGYVVGGDYAEADAPGFFARTSDGGASWGATIPRRSAHGPRCERERAWRADGSVTVREPMIPLRGFRSDVAVAGEELVVVGSSGSDVSRDEGATWTALGDEALNAVGAADGVMFAVGPGGAIARRETR